MITKSPTLNTRSTLFVVAENIMREDIIHKGIPRSRMSIKTPIPP
jgi:hypothetical protein